jgi:hypothetical protein
MSNTAITELVAISAGVLSLSAFVGLVFVPAVKAYERTWERVAAGLLSLWVLGALFAVGLLAGLAVIYYWPRVF